MILFKVYKLYKINKLHKMDVTFLFYSHSDFSDLWTIIRDQTNIYIPAYKRIIAINSNSTKMPDGFDAVITYDDTLNYSDKVASLLNHITTKYVVFIHDNDFIITFSDSIFTELMTIVEEYNIDRCMFGILGKNNATIKGNGFSIVNARNTYTPHFIYPYDVGPSIWRTNALKDAMAIVPNCSYRDIEESEIQNYCKNSLRVFGFCIEDGQKAYFCIGRPFPEQFQFLHFTRSGGFYQPYTYMDQETNFNKLREKYPDTSHRKMFTLDDEEGKYMQYMASFRTI
jgi:hypothetical protein